MIEFSIERDDKSQPAYAISFPDFSDSCFSVILSSAGKSIAVPSGARLAIISCSDHFFVGTSAVVVPGETFSASNAVLNYTQISVANVSTLYFKSQNLCDLTVSFYS